MLSFRFIVSIVGQFRPAALLLTAALTLGLPFHATAGEAKVVKVSAKQNSENLWRFSVTVRHKDKGWKHYADNWEVLSPDGEILATRVLAHPHVNEQPFTRSLSGVKIPDGLTHVIIRAHDSVHGYGDQKMRVDLATGKAVKFKDDVTSEPAAEN